MENGRVRYNMIKWLVFAITVLASFFCNGQQYFTFASKMSVLETNINNERHCYDTIKVIWQIRHDTNYFIFKDHVIKLFAISKKQKPRHKREKIQLATQQIEKHNINLGLDNRIWYIMQDERNELYWLSFMKPDRYNDNNVNFSFYIVSLEYGLPNYLIVFDRKTLLCD